MALEPAGNDQGVLAMALDPQRERLEALQEEERVERAEGRPQVPQALDPQLEDECQRTERAGVANPVIARIRIDEVGAEALRGGPVERPAIDHHSADRGAVAADPFGRRVDDDVRAVLDRLGQQRCERVVHDERYAVGVGDVRN